LPPPVTKGQREAAEPQRRGLIIVAVAAAVVVIVAVALLVRVDPERSAPLADRFAELTRSGLAE